MLTSHREGREGEGRRFSRVIQSLDRMPFWGLRRERAARRLTELCQGLLSERGEVSGVRLATETLRSYRSLNAHSRDVFLEALATRFAPSPVNIVQAADSYRQSPSPESLSRLQTAVESPRQELFRRLNLAKGGIDTLIEMRRHLLGALDDHPTWAAVDADLAHLFRSWFNGGFLVLRRIDWSSSAVVLERLIEREAVHEIQGWRDLRRRLEADRRCYAFFHPTLPDEPLVFIEVALTKGTSRQVQPLLDPDSRIMPAADADTAVFYSITNCQTGLRGVSFGNLLIKRVVDDLSRELSRVKHFVTLSPIPGFRSWLTAALTSLPASPLRDDLLAIADAAGSQPAESPAPPTPVRTELTRLCAYYLIHARRGSLPADAVARFHLANGARLARLNWMGDTSENGIRQSIGFMANYSYDVASLERNHEEYANAHRVVASRRLRWLAKRAVVCARSASHPPSTRPEAGRVAASA